MKYCPSCKINYADDALFCTECKRELEVKKENEKVPKKFWWFLLGTFGFIIFIMLFYTLLTNFGK